MHATKNFYSLPVVMRATPLSSAVMGAAPSYISGHAGHTFVYRRSCRPPLQSLAVMLYKCTINYYQYLNNTNNKHLLGFRKLIRYALSLPHRRSTRAQPSFIVSSSPLVAVKTLFVHRRRFNHFPPHFRSLENSLIDYILLIFR